MNNSKEIVRDLKYFVYSDYLNNDNEEMKLFLESLSKKVIHSIESFIKKNKLEYKEVESVKNIENYEIIQFLKLHKIEEKIKFYNIEEVISFNLGEKIIKNEEKTKIINYYNYILKKFCILLNFRHLHDDDISFINEDKFIILEKKSNYSLFI